MNEEEKKAIEMPDKFITEHKLYNIKQKVLYFKGKIIGGIYYDRFLVKPTKSAKRLMPEAAYETPYTGAKDMLLVDNIDDSDFLRELLEALYADLTA